LKLLILVKMKRIVKCHWTFFSFHVFIS